MRIPLNPSFDAPILSFKSSWAIRVDGLFQPENIEEDQLALFIRKQKEIEADVLNVDLGVEEEEREIHSNLGLQHA